MFVIKLFYYRKAYHKSTRNLNGIFQILFLLLVLVVQIIAIIIIDVYPPSGFHVVHPDDASRVGISVCGVIDGSAAKIVRFLVSQIPFVAGI